MSLLTPEQTARFYRDAPSGPATVEQPPPTEGSGREVWAGILERHPDLPAGLLADMRARDALGRERYGTPLREWNGRDAIADAYQESLDLVAYLEQARLRMWSEARAGEGFAGKPSRVVIEAIMSLEHAVSGAIRAADQLRQLHASGLVPVEPRRAP